MQKDFCNSIGPFRHLVRCSVMSGVAGKWLAPGHHGYQRACDLISGQASTGPFGSLVLVRARERRRIVFSIVFSRLLSSALSVFQIDDVEMKFLSANSISEFSHGLGRVEMWRGSFRSNISVAASFVWRCLSGSTMTPFPHPAHRTGRADLPHPALGQDFTLCFRMQRHRQFLNTLWSL